MPVRPTVVAPALKALLDRFIDYAGVFPPAALSLGQTLSNFEEYRGGNYAWMLRSIVVQSGQLAQIPATLDVNLAVLADADVARAASLEAKDIIAAGRPVYVEVPPDDPERLDAIKAAGCFAKIRTGGLKPEAIPSIAQVSGFIRACAQRRLPFKATAGLHHPIRAEHPLTYEAGAPQATMHGFLNVLLAACFAWQGKLDIEAVIAETATSAFRFDDAAHWRSESLTVKQISEARDKFMHSVGSCSFVEPVQDLQALKLID